MNPALEKTISVLLLIILGFLLKYKIHSKDQIKGIKTLILSIALPATIFIALLKIEFTASLFYLPVFALLLNVLLYILIRYSLPWFQIDPDSQRGRTLALLFPSLAPGLSCFPFIMEYGSEAALAMAALADVGNKVFVLVILYLIAMRWYFGNSPAARPRSSKSRLKLLLLSLVKEPVNLAILLAIGLLYAGWNLESLPLFLQDPVRKMSALMTPMVLLFIGMAISIDLRQFRAIGKLLLYRSALTFLISGLFLLLFPVPLSMPLILVVVAFPQSAVSFWPFAHMSVVSESEADGATSTFDLKLALNFLALSLPFSTILVLCISVFPKVFLQGGNLLLIALGLFLLLLIPRIWQTVLIKLRPFKAPEQVSKWS